MTFGIKENVLWFEVTVDDVLLMEVAQRRSDLGGIEPGGRKREAGKKRGEGSRDQGLI